LLPLLGLERFDRRALNRTLAGLTTTDRSVQIVLQADDAADTPTVVRDVFSLDREALAPDTVGLQLGEAHDLLTAVQHTVVTHQVNTAITTQQACPHCGQARRHKDQRTIVLRTLFGALRLPSPRWWHCPCQPQRTRTFRPLAVLLPERSTPELVYLQAKFAALTSYAISAQLLAEVLPLGRRPDPTVLRRQVQATAHRLEGELGEEQVSFIDTCQRDRDALARPDLPITVGLDGGYVHSATQHSRRDGWFEVIAGKVMPTHGKPTCFGYVQTYDTKPKRRLFEVLNSHGMQPNQQITFVTDGGEDIRDLPRFLNPQAEHLLDWFHITMRLTVMSTMAKGLRAPPPDPDEFQPAARCDLATEVGKSLESLKWFLWHGNVYRALQTIEDLQCQLDEGGEETTFEQARLVKAMREFDTYIRANADRIPNYGEHHRAGETISSSFVESAVNQVISKRVVKKQRSLPSSSRLVRAPGVPELFPIAASPR